MHLRAPAEFDAFFSFLYLKKIKISKTYGRSKKFQKCALVACRPWGGRHAPCRPGRGRHAFFIKKNYKPVLDQRGAGARRRRQGGRSPPRATGSPPLYKPPTPIPSSFEPKNSTKNPEKKRGVRRREAAKPCRITHLWSAGNYIWRHWYYITI